MEDKNPLMNVCFFPTEKPDFLVSTDFISSPVLISSWHKRERENEKKGHKVVV